MRQFLQSSEDRPVTAYVRFFLLLLLMAGGMVTYMSITGCDCDDSQKIRQMMASMKAMQTSNSMVFRPVPPAPRTGNILAENSQLVHSYTPGQRIQRRFVYERRSGETENSHIHWTPPPGATNIRYLNMQPNSTLFGKHVFTDVPPGEQGGVLVEYEVPSLSPSMTDYAATDHVEIYFPGGACDTVESTYLVSRVSAQSAQDSQAAWSPTTLQTALVAAEPGAWELTQFISSETLTLTTATCQDLIDDLQSEDSFFLVRAPVEANPSGGAFHLPIDLSAGSAPELAMTSDFSLEPVLTSTLELRPQRSSTLQNALPSVDGEAWLALGVPVSPTLTCPDGLNQAPQKWDVQLSYTLHLDNAARTLPTYTCWEGQEQPGAESGLVGAMLAISKTPAVEAGGVTCLGPSAFLLSEMSSPASVWLNESASQVITHTVPITIFHFMQSTSPSGATLSLSSDLDAGWQLYRGAWETGPDLSRPITGTLSGSTFEPFFAIGVPPASAGPGLYTLVITATSVLSPEMSSWVSDFLWLGDWVPPEPVPAPAVPALLLPSNGAIAGSPAVTLTWQTSPGEPPTYFNFELDSQVITTTNTSAAVQLAQGTHTWTARACNGSGCSAWAARRSLTVRQGYELYLPLTETRKE